MTLPILPVLAETCGPALAAILHSSSVLTAIRSTSDHSAISFAKRAVQPACNRSAHGLRKIAATRAANAGATVAQLEAIFGWNGGRMASLYTRAADRRQLAIERCTSSRTMSELLFPHLGKRCRHLRRITNEFKTEKRVCRGSDPRHLRLTMDGLLDRHMWGATPCIKIVASQG